MYTDYLSYYQTKSNPPSNPRSNDERATDAKPMKPIHTHVQKSNFTIASFSQLYIAFALACLLFFSLA
jgi:hypothetical protein